MVHLTRIYTRTGDDGSTALGDFTRVDKTDSRLVAYADTHEANASIGVAVALLREKEPAAAGSDFDTETLAAVLERTQNDLFDVGADLSVPRNPNPSGPELRVHEDWITELEEYCDQFGEYLPKLHSFILPGGSVVGAQLHVASTVVRRAERAAWAAIAEFGDDPDGGVNPLTAKYLNRLSDLLFILARYANGTAGDILWRPAGGRREAPKKRGS